MTWRKVKKVVLVKRKHRQVISQMSSLNFASNVEMIKIIFESVDFVLNHRKQFNFQVQTRKKLLISKVCQVSESVSNFSYSMTAQTFFDSKIACSGISRGMFGSNFSPTNIEALLFQLKLFCYKTPLAFAPKACLCSVHEWKSLSMAENVNFPAKPCGLSWHTNNDTLFTSFVQLKCFRRL